MAEYQLFNNPALAKEIVQAIHQLVQKHPILQHPINIMEVCGTHTMEIGRLGIRRLLPANINLLSGPGCPVCVTPANYLDLAIQLAQTKGVCLVTFGDMLNVPGKTTSLAQAKAQGAQVEVVTSPGRIIILAQNQPQTEFVFTAVGFETTAPATAQTLLEAARRKLLNVSFLAAHRIVPPVLRILLEDPELKLSGFLLPGHVSAIIGERAYTSLITYGMPGVITGFEPVDILSSILASLQLLIRPEKNYIKNMYTRVVTYQGNEKAQAICAEVYEPEDAVLRGIGMVAGCGLRIKKAYQAYDATLRYECVLTGDEMPVGCGCGLVLKGKIRPDECTLFKKTCRPEHPVGPCMVSTEGSCAAYYRYGY